MQSHGHNLLTVRRDQKKESQHDQGPLNIPDTRMYAYLLPMSHVDTLASIQPNRNRIA